MVALLVFFFPPFSSSFSVVEHATLGWCHGAGKCVVACSLPRHYRVRTVHQSAPVYVCAALIKVRERTKKQAADGGRQTKRKGCRGWWWCGGPGGRGGRGSSGYDSADDEGLVSVPVCLLSSLRRQRGGQGVQALCRKNVKMDFSVFKMASFSTFQQAYEASSFWVSEIDTGVLTELGSLPDIRGARKHSA